MNIVESASSGRLSVAVAAFLSEKTAVLSPYSVAHLRASLTRLTTALGDPPVAVVTYADLRGYVDGLHLRYKPGTIRPIVGDIRQFFKWAKKRGHVRSNPAKRLRAPSRRVVRQSANPRATPEEDALRLIQHLAGSLSHLIYRDLFGNLCAADRWGYQELQALRNLFIVVFVYETGARIGEVRQLGTRAMNDALEQTGPAYCIVVTGKTFDRAMWFTAATAELWRLWQQVRPRGCDELAIVGWYDHCDPKPIQDRSTLSHMIARCCESAGIAPFRAHALRHAKARRSRRAVGLEVTNRLLDHSSITVTADYAAVYDDELSAAAAKTGLAQRLWS